jgi:nicotinate-nucleotide adenylyltransferase
LLFAEKDSTIYERESFVQQDVRQLYQVKTITAFLERTLSKKRFQHSCNVARAAKQLAQRYGADQENAYFAGLVHDICKEMDMEEQRRLMLAGDFAPDEAELHSKKLWHGIAGAYFLRTEFGVTDWDILLAVRFHAVGRQDMSLLEEIIYMADMISEERDYKGVARMRKLAFEDLQEAMLEALEDAIASVLKKQGMIPQYTIAAYNGYLLKKEAKKKES